MAIQADLGPPVLPPLPLQPPLKPPSLAVRSSRSTDANSNNNSNNGSRSLPQSQQSRQQEQQQQQQQHQQHFNHRNNHHRQHVYQQRHPAVYSPYPSIVSSFSRQQRAIAATTRQERTPIIPPSSTPTGTGASTTLVNTSPRKDAPLPRTPGSATPSKTSRSQKQQQQQRQPPRAAAAPNTPPTPTTAATAAQQPAQKAKAVVVVRPPPPAHRRIRYHQHHASRASARSELTSLTSGPLNNSLLQMTSQTPMLTWPQKCVLAMSKARYLASEPSVARQVFRSYYDDRGDADDWMADNEMAAVPSGLPSPPPEQEDYYFRFGADHDGGNGNAAVATAAVEHHYYHNQLGIGRADAGEVSSLSSEEPSANIMGLPPTGNDAAGGEVSPLSPSSNPSPKPLVPPEPLHQRKPHQRSPSVPRAPPTSTLVSHLTVGAAVFRIDVRSQRPTILLLKTRAAAAAAAPATTGPASGPPSPYQQHHPPHHYNRHENSRHPDDEAASSSPPPPPPPPPTWELPSGRVEDSDYCISDAIARCVKRQTSLNVVRISSMLRETTATTTTNAAASRRDRQNVDYDPLRALPRGAAFTSAEGDLAGGSVRFLDEEGWPDLTSPQDEKMQLQLNWTVLVANVDDVVLQGVEHEEFVWANWNVLDMLNLTSATREVAKEALEWAGRCSF